MFQIIACIFIIIQIIRFLRLFEACTPPKLYHSGTNFASKVLKRCPSLTQVYEPPGIWGKCGHIQTFFYGKIGRFNTPLPLGERFYKTLPSKETITYDIFQPLNDHKTRGDYTILVCPGIANSSEKSYVRTFVKYATESGFRVCVLNHIGSLANVKLTSPKIFTYGDTRYFASMIETVEKMYSDSTFLIVGYSMGGNIAMKYLGENSERQKKILCGVSLCQGYDAVRSTEPMKIGYRRVIYNRMITTNIKKIIRPHWDDLFSSGDSNQQSANYDADQIRSAKFLHDIEDGLLRRIDGHESVYAYMDKAGCCHVIDKVNIPVLLVNTEDDPVVVNDVHDIPKNYSESHPEAIFATYKFGGHLGYYTGSWYKPDDVTLVEKMIIEYIDSIIDIRQKKVHAD
uniref:monoacylglycerol lipase ABHD2-like n=1 Tax=Styela clava TaxID=7725 RepID=UPI00193A0A7B|nr:monoacylglycerol lipase ABHD2-like [Styela clava]